MGSVTGGAAVLDVRMDCRKQRKIYSCWFNVRSTLGQKRTCWSEFQAIRPKHQLSSLTHKAVLSVSGGTISGGNNVTNLVAAFAG